MPVFSSLEIYDDAVPRSAPMNMALDEVFWQSARAPRLRFYQWDHPALSFGYFGRYAEVVPFEDERELVRRCTGGGIVFHGRDLTYGLIIPADQLANGGSPISIYTRVHEAIQNALRQCGIEGVLVAQSNSSHFATATETVGNQHSPNACFANPVAADVLVEGRKVAGAAQRRSRRGLLQQGSIQNIQLPNDFRARFVHSLCANAVTCDIDSAALDKARQLADTKYGTDDWLRQR